MYMGDINIPHSMQRHMGTAIDGNYPTSLDECTQGHWMGVHGDIGWVYMGTLDGCTWGHWMGVLGGIGWVYMKGAVDGVHGGHWMCVYMTHVEHSMGVCDGDIGWVCMGGIG